MPTRWYWKLNEVIQTLKLKISCKMPRIGNISSKSNNLEEAQDDDNTYYDVNESAEEPINLGNRKGKGKGKNSIRTKKLSIQS